MILLPNCRCCRSCPCDAATIYFGNLANTVLTFHFTGGQSADACKNEPGTLYVADASRCEYYADYDLNDRREGCTVRVWFIVSGNECDCNDSGQWCAYTINGYSGGNCGLLYVTDSATECAV